MKKLIKNITRKKNAPIIYNGYKNETIVKEFTDGSYVSVISAEEKNTFRRQKILQIREMIDLSLNFTMGQNWTPVNEKTYIYVNKKKVIGCAIAESIESAYKVIPNSTDSTLDPSLIQSHQCIISHEAQSAIIGISRIWIHAQYRRQGIASTLLDTIRHHFVYGLSVKKESLAVTQPSTEGLLFANKYFGTGEFLVYTPN